MNNTKATIEKKDHGRVVGYKTLVVPGRVSHLKIEVMARSAFGPGECVESGMTEWEPGQYDLDSNGVRIDGH